MIKTILVCLLTCTLHMCWSADKPLHIACIGDSITQGRGGDKPEQSWRYPFWKHLVDNKINFTFVGSTTTGFHSTPEYPDYKNSKFPNIHEGHWGWTTDGINAKMPGWIKNYKQLDIALILLGANDGGQGKKAKLSVEEIVTQTCKEYGELVAILRKKNPKVKIVFAENPPAWDPFPQLNAGLKEFAKKNSSKDSPIAVAITSKGWISHPDKENSDTIDWVHTSVRGDKKIADAFWATLKPMLAEQLKNKP